MASVRGTPAATQPLRLFILAGEPSGDRIGADLVRRLRSRVELSVSGVGGDALMAEAPAGLPSAIEARGLGLLAADLAGAVPLRLIVDLGQAEPERLPPRRLITLLGCPIALVLGRGATHLAAGLMQYLRRGRFA